MSLCDKSDRSDLLFLVRRKHLHLLEISSKNAEELTFFEGLGMIKGALLPLMTA